jgi:hypothetical protein|tara:strand:+ start:331 stop:963 length:633 start_codon:yes stop_codon:yes gene_type:complete
MHILIACDQAYYDKWGIELLKSTRYYNPHSWLNLHCHIVNPRLGFEQVEGVDYTTEVNSNVSIAYLQAVRFIVAQGKLPKDDLVMILDADTVCTKEFTKEEFIEATSNITILKHHKSGALHQWLCGMVTFGTGKFRHDYVHNLLKKKIPEWEYGHDQDILNLCAEHYEFNNAHPDWICMGKQNLNSVFLTLKGTHKLNPKYTNQFERYKF